MVDYFIRCAGQSASINDVISALELILFANTEFHAHSVSCFHQMGSAEMGQIEDALVSARVSHPRLMIVRWRSQEE